MITLLTILFFGIPTVSITSHINNQIIKSGEVTIKATATDVSGIKKVVFYNGTTSVGTSIVPPYTTTINLKAGQYKVRAIAYSNTGSQRTASVTLNVENDYTEDMNALIARMTAIENDLKITKDSLQSLQNYVNTQDTVMFDPARFQVINQTPTLTYIKLK